MSNPHEESYLKGAREPSRTTGSDRGAADHRPRSPALMNYLGVNQYAVCARCVRRSEPPISHDVLGQDVVTRALAAVARCASLRARVRVPFRILRAVCVERQVNV